MSALAGEPWRGACRASIFVTATPANNHQAWASFDVNASAPAGDQATWQGTPGSSLTLRFRWHQGGGGSGQQTPNFATVRAMLPNGGGQIGTDWTVAFPAADTEVTRTFHFDDDPMNAVLGAIRAGMVELYLTWGSTGGATPWSIDSRGASTGTILGTNTREWARGKAAAPVTLTGFSISDAALGGAEPSVFYATKPTYNRVTLDAAWYRGAALLLKHRQSAADVRSSDADSAAATAAQRDYSWTASAAGSGNKGRVNADYAHSLSAADARVVLPANSFNGTSNDNEYVFAASGHLTDWTIVDQSTIEKTARFTADPRIPFDHLLQVDDTTFGTPPLSKDVATGARQTSSLGAIAARVKDEAGTGLNGVSWTEKLWDAANLISSEAAPWNTRACTSQTKGGQDGWADGFLIWDAQLPDGTWNQKEVITAPADLVGLEVNNTRVLVLLAKNPNYVVVPAGGTNDAAQVGTHFIAGRPFIAGGVLIDVVNQSFPSVDASPAPFVFIGRFNLALGRIEVLNDVSGTPTWQSAAATAGAWTKWPLTQSPGDANARIVTFAKELTANWGAYTPKCLPILYHNGTPYGLPGDALTSGEFNPHDVQQASEVTMLDAARPALK